MLFHKFFRSKIEIDVENAVTKVVERKLQEALDAFGNVDVLTAERSDADARRLELESTIAGLERAAASLQDDMAREREKLARDKLTVDHALGLEQTRQEQDNDFAQKQLAADRAQMVKEQEVAVKEAVLDAKTEAAEEARTRMTEFVDRQEKMIERLLDAQPDHKIKEKR